MIKAIKNLTKKQIIIIVSSLVVLTGVVTTTIILLNKDEEEIKKCLVEFDTNGGSTINSQEITCGNTIKEPSDKPEKTGFEFINWTYNNEKFNFNTKINENIVLIANYNKTTNEEIITITFNSDGGTEVKSIELIKGTTITEPVNPTKQNYNFEGWYLNETKFDFSQEINENITLIAKWSEKKNNQGNNNKPNGGTNTNQGQTGGNQGNNQGSQGGNQGNTTTPEKKLVYVKEAEEVKTCQNGYTLDNRECVKEVAKKKENICSGSVGYDYSELNGKCYKISAAAKIPTCNGNDEYVSYEYHLDYGNLHDVCIPNNDYANRYPAIFQYKCYDNRTLTGDKCYEEINYTTSYICPSGYETACESSVCPCIMKSQPTITYTCGNLIKQDNKCYRYE